MRTLQQYFWPVVVAVAAVIVIIGMALVPLYTDWLWFKDIGYSSVFSTILWTRVKIGLLLGLLFFGIIYGNLWYARKIAPPAAPMGIEQQLLERLGSLARRGLGLLIFVGSLVISALVGLEAATHWEEWLKYFNASSFGATDPVFGLDIGFYVFKLPFLSYVYYWLFFALFAATVASALLHYADEALEFYGNHLQFAPRVKAHLFTLVAAMFFLKAWGYRLAMYDMLSARGNLIDGPGFAAIHARIPALWIMLVIAILAGLLVLLNIRRRGIGYATAALVLLVGASILVGAGYPGIVQQFSVSPNELQKEQPYIERAIAATREAYGLRDVAAREFAADSSLTAAQVVANRGTIDNIRLWDEGHLKDALNQIQTIQQYYTFNDVDVDRYWVTMPDGTRTYRQVWLAARELSQESLPEPSRTWINRHLQYTHGYGFVMSPVNEFSQEGLPEFFIYDIPPKKRIEMELERVGIYFGEVTNEYVFVDTSAEEFDYPIGSEAKTISYQAEGGVAIGSLFRKLLFAVRFSDVNILLNDNIRPGSRILYKREIRERIGTLLPFLEFDNDPYLITSAGRLYWMRDGYTTTDNYPYAQHSQAGLYYYNYIRNSVKVVVDAYSGEVDAYYVTEPLADPVIDTFRKIFPGVFKPISDMPEDLRGHIRYPENLFTIQMTIYQRYHQTNPTMFYNNSDLWAVPRRGQLVRADEEPELMEPYYVIMKLPNGTREELIMMTPFIRAGKTNMVSWMCAKCDSPDYGRLVLYQFPRDKNIFGPQQIAARARQDTVISQQITLWSQQGSEVGSGNLMVIPVENSLMYVMPVYLSSTDTRIPELKRVIVALGDQVSMEPSIDQALAAVMDVPTEALGAATPSAPAATPAIPAAPAVPTPATPPAAPPAAGGASDERVNTLINRAVDQHRSALEAQRSGNWAEYGRRMDELEETLNDLQQAAR